MSTFAPTEQIAQRLNHAWADRRRWPLVSVAGATLNTLVQLDPIYVSFNPAEVNLPAITHQQDRAPIETAVVVGDVAAVKAKV